MLVNSATSDEYRHSFLTQIAQHIFLESFKLNWNDGLVPPHPPPLLRLNNPTLQMYYIE